MMQRPYVAPGIGWILAVVVAITAVLVLFHAIVATVEVTFLCILGLALAVLL